MSVYPSTGDKKCHRDRIGKSFYDGFIELFFKPLLGRGAEVGGEGDPSDAMGDTIILERERGGAALCEKSAVSRLSAWMCFGRYA